MTEVEHVFWSEKRNANFGFLSTLSVLLRFETVVNGTGALCYRISVVFAEDPSVLFNTLLTATDCTKYVKETSEFSQRLHELVLDKNSILDLVALNDDGRLILSVRAVNEQSRSELRWFSAIITRASAVEQNAHIKMLFAQSQSDLAAERVETNRLRAENRILQSELKSLEDATTLIRQTLDKVVRFYSASTSAPSASNLSSRISTGNNQEDLNLPDSLANKSALASRHSNSASPLDLRINTTSTTNQELLLGIASYLLCAVCEKVSVPINDPNELSRHFIDEHVNNAKCLACPEANVFDLVSHIKTHTHRVYACEFCGKKGRKHYLQSHVRTHTGEKPFKCPTCGRRFADPSTIRRHQTTVHAAKKKFICPVCGRDISRKDNYRVHLKSHSNTLPATNNETENEVVGETGRSLVFSGCDPAETTEPESSGIETKDIELIVSN